MNAGEAYWSGTGQANLNIDSSEKTATIAAYTFLKTLAGNVSQNLLINPTYQVASQPTKVSLKDNAINRPIITQVRGASGASADATTIQNRIQDIIDIIDGGSGTETITYGHSCDCVSVFPVVGVTVTPRTMSPTTGSKRVRASKLNGVSDLLVRFAPL